MKKTSNQKGFTIIELLLATLIFSMVLVVILASFLQIGRMFYKGVSVNNTQETARTVVDSITNDLKLGKSFDPGGNYNGGSKYFCVGQHRYLYNINHLKVNSDDVTKPSQSAPAGIIRASIGGGCPSPAAYPGTDVEQLMSPDMQLNALEVAPAPGGNLYNVHIHLIFYGADDSVFISNAHPNDPGLAIKDADAHCSGSLISTQFCAASDINAAVALRY